MSVYSSLYDKHNQTLAGGLVDGLSLLLGEVALANCQAMGWMCTWTHHRLSVLQHVHPSDYP